MSSSIVLTVVSDDRPGIVGSLSQTLDDHGGSWEESSMMSLAGKFAGILLARVPADRVAPFLESLAELESQGLQIVAQITSPEPATGGSRELSIELVGQDHPGIVHEITEVLARHRINVQELETTVQSASMSGETLFLAHARVFIPADISLEAFQDELEELANELMVDINLED